MLMNGKIMFDRYYCINSAQTKEIMTHFILQPCHIFILIKAFILMFIPSIVQLAHAWHPVIIHSFFLHYKLVNIM